MTDQEIFEELCCHETDKDTGRKPNDCFCDNCFYGRTRLAEYIIQLKGLDKKQFIENYLKN